jgi:hypothetical protein
LDDLQSARMGIDNELSDLQIASQARALTEGELEHQRRLRAQADKIKAEIAKTCRTSSSVMRSKPTLRRSALSLIREYAGHPSGPGYPPHQFHETEDKRAIGMSEYRTKASHVGAPYLTRARVG